jgi:hypothetical protein
LAYFLSSTLLWRGPPMGFKVKRIAYFKTTIANERGSEARLLSLFSRAGISYLAFESSVLDERRIEFTLYPNDEAVLLGVAREQGLELDGPHAALHIEGDDETGACAEVFDSLAKAGVKTDLAFGIADIKDGYGIVLYLDEADCERAMAALA